MSKKQDSNLPEFLQDLYNFAVQSQMFLKKCDKPDSKGKRHFFRKFSPINL